MQRSGKDSTLQLLAALTRSQEAKDQDVKEAAALMQSKQIRRVLVVNREKQPVGMLSLADLARHVQDPKLTGVTVEEVSSPLETLKDTNPA